MNSQTEHVPSESVKVEIEKDASVGPRGDRGSNLMPKQAKGPRDGLHMTQWIKWIERKFRVSTREKARRPSPTKKSSAVVAPPGSTVKA